MGAFKLGKMTFGSLFKKPETVLYPLESKPKPVGLKGHIELDAPTCILCGMCERSCATDCIKVDKQQRTWQIDRLSCIQCGYCITVCPKKCLSMDPTCAPATIAYVVDVVEVPEAEDAPKKAADKPKGAAVAPADEKPQANDAATTAPIEAVPTQQEPEGWSDAQVSVLLKIMDGEKAVKVKEALGMKAE